MPVLVWWILIGVVVLGHEVLTARAGGGQGRRTPLLRYAALLLIVLLAVRIGGGLGRVAPAAGSDRGLVVLPDAPRPETSFQPSGDPALGRRAREQRPLNPYPTDGDRAAVRRWRDTVTQRLRTLFDYRSGAAGSVDYVLHHSEVLGTVRRQLISFTADDGTSIPAYVCEPVAAGTDRLGVLVIPGHGRGIVGTAGLIEDYQHGAAMALARSGFVAITPELRGFGMLGPDLDLDHAAVAHNAVLSGTFYKAVVAADLGRAIDVLQRWPTVDAAALAVTGASYGGEMATTMAVLDQRLRLVAVNAAGLYCGPLPPATGAANDEPPHGCHLIPGGNTLVHLEDWHRLLAPRPLLVVHGRRDVPDTAARFTQLVEEAYAACDAREAVTISIVDGTHAFHVQPTIDFLTRHR